MSKEEIKEDLEDRGLIIGIEPNNEGVIKLVDVIDYVYNKMNLVKNNVVLDDVINSKPPLWMCPNTISIAKQLHDKDNGNGELVVKAVRYIENEALQFGYTIGYANAKTLLKAYCL